MSEEGSTCEGELCPFDLQRGVLLGNQSVPSPGSLLDGFPKEKLPADHTGLGATVRKQVILTKSILEVRVFLRAMIPEG